MKCHQCHTELPIGAKFCFNCGAPQLQQQTATSEPPPIDFSANVAPQLERYFFERFSSRIRAEHDPQKLTAYNERLYESGFRDIVNRRVEQMAEHIRTYEDMDQDAYPLKMELKYSIEELLDFFIIRYCSDLNDIKLPEAILKYQDLNLENIDLSEMVADYLAFDQEKETVYVDFIKMPLEKLRNASKSFLFPAKDEKIFFICDQSLLGSCREGFALTEKAIYWKATLEKARSVAYHNLISVEREKDWLSINKQFFNVNPSLNLKLLKLLKRIGFGRP